MCRLRKHCERIFSLILQIINLPQLCFLVVVDDDIYFNLRAIYYDFGLVHRPSNLILQKHGEQCNSVVISLTINACCLAWIGAVVVISFFIFSPSQSVIGCNFICCNSNTILKLKQTFLRKTAFALQIHVNHERIITECYANL